MQCTHSYCLMVTLRDGTRLIVPCQELIRFYFGSSSSLLTKLFFLPLTRNQLFVGGQYNQWSGHLKVDLATGIPGASAADVGRIFVDDAAWRAALHVDTSLLKASSAGQPAYPQAFFPFEGKTNLVAAGKWRSFGDKPRATFLVFSLRSCSHPFPFKSLRYNVTAKRLTARLDSPVAGNLPPKRRVRRTSSSSADQNLVENDASTKLYTTSDSSSNDLWHTTRCAAGDFIARREPKQESIAQLIGRVFDGAQ